MKIKYFNPEGLNKFETIKDYTVYQKNNKVYKISDDSEDLIRKLDKYKKQFSNIAFALELLYDTHGYYGFVMKYYEKIEKLSSLLLYDNIDYSTIIKEIIQTLKRLEELNILYFDITENNIVSYNKHVLFLDMDGCIDSNITDKDKRHQRQKLISFLILLPMDELIKKEYRVRISQLLNLICRYELFNTTFIEYIYEMQRGDTIVDYPIDFLSDFTDLDKIKFLERKLR